MKQRIDNLYGSVDKMLEITGISISRGYIYQILNGDKTNITLKVAIELKDILQLNSLDELIDMIERIEE